MKQDEPPTFVEYMIVFFVLGTVVFLVLLAALHLIFFIARAQLEINIYFCIGGYYIFWFGVAAPFLYREAKKKEK